MGVEKNYGYCCSAPLWFRLLKESYLAGKQLTGSIPPQLGQLTALARLQLERNNLEGAIPETLNQIPPSTLYFRVNDNHLNADAQVNAIILGTLQAWYDSIPVDSKDISRQAPPLQPGVEIDPSSGLVTTENGGSDSFGVVLKRIPTGDVIIAFASSDTSEGNIAPSSDLITNEDGGMAVFNVFLSTQPASDVTIDLSSSDETEGMVQPGSLRFTPQDWNNPITVTITGQDDTAFDHDQDYVIFTSNTSSADNNYNNIDIPDVTVTNEDNETCSSPPDNVVIGFSSFSTSPDPYICIGHLY